MHRLETRIPPVVVGVVAAAIGWAVGRIDLDGTPLDNTFGTFLALALAVVGVSVAIAGMVEFRRAHTTVNPHSIDQASNIVTTGIFRFTRNPMYVGMGFVVAGACAGFGTVVGLVVAVAGFVTVLTRLQIIPEERMLDHKFGVVYTQYRTQARRWL